MRRGSREALKIIRQYRLFFFFSALPGSIYVYAQRCLGVCAHVLAFSLQVEGHGAK